MAQTLLLGLGGTGSRIVNHVAAELRKNNFTINDGNICCAVLDTNDNDRKKIAETGVGIPVVGTSKDRSIEAYMQMYKNKGVYDWMPESAALLKESMKDGASQMRTKSRLAFMDTVTDRSIRQLEQHIEKLFDKRDGTQIRVMVVSSLAGGTGSGMFIQTALWLRKYFARRKCDVTLRGIFVLPDVFISTLEDIRTDNTEIQSLYANAYGAIRELNAITKIKAKGMKPMLPVKIDDLFDSDKDRNQGEPVYDYAFFVDDISEGGSVLTELAQYEKVVARLVYMQLYAPMHDDLYSEEDNLFKRFQKSEEPLFGSCGTAKAVYPTEDVLRYCTLRAAQQAISTGWRKIDEEIKEKQRKEEERERGGVVLSHRIDPRMEYLRIFDAKASKSGNQVGHDRLFVNIGNDVKNEEKFPADDGTVQVSYTDKVEDLWERIDELVAATVDTQDVGNLSRLRLKKNWASQTTDTVDSLIAMVEKKKTDVQRFVDAVDSSVDAMAEELLDLLCPAGMGDINRDNETSVYGFLTKKDKNGESCFVHPIAVRYLLYKLAAKLDEVKDSIVTDKLRQAAEKGYGNGKKKIDFDNARTKGKVEDDAVSYLKSRAFLQNEEKFLQTFKSLYSQHNEGQAELCRTYAIESVKLRLAVVLSKRVDKLIRTVEDFFNNLVKVSNTMQDALAQNIRENSVISQKVIYVCASAEEKEALYRSLRLDTDHSDANINAIVVSALYGQFCAEENPEAEQNQPYKGKSVENIFFKEVIAAYSKLIMDKNKDDVDLDIYTAICKSVDFAYEKEQKDAQAAESDRLNVDLKTGETLADDSRYQRHIAAMIGIVERLRDLGAPFLISDEEQPEDSDEHLTGEEAEPDVFTPIKKRKTFWGFHPIVAEKCPALGQILGVSVTAQQNKAYAKNELDCYRAVYGIQAGHVEKFNELKNGDYYRNYRRVVREMIAGVSNGHPEELIFTPHLDKTWHLFLPYITPEKQVREDSKFFRLFWLAAAYGMLSVDKHGKYQIQRIKSTAIGQYRQDEPVLHNGQPIGKVDVLKLLTALKLDGSFAIDAAPLEERFRAECENLDSYEGTWFLRGDVKNQIDGGLASKLDTNAVTMIVRYQNDTKQNTDTTAMLIQALEQLCFELAAANYDGADETKIRIKSYELCMRIYDASAMKDKDINLIKHWKTASKGK